MRGTSGLIETDQALILNGYLVEEAAVLIGENYNRVRLKPWLAWWS